MRLPVPDLVCGGRGDGPCWGCNPGLSPILLLWARGWMSPPAQHGEVRQTHAHVSTRTHTRAHAHAYARPRLLRLRSKPRDSRTRRSSLSRGKPRERSLPPRECKLSRAHSRAPQRARPVQSCGTGRSAPAPASRTKDLKHVRSRALAADIRAQCVGRCPPASEAVSACARGSRGARRRHGRSRSPRARAAARQTRPREPDANGRKERGPSPVSLLTRGDLFGYFVGLLMIIRGELISSLVKVRFMQSK